MEAHKTSDFSVRRDLRRHFHLKRKVPCQISGHKYYPVEPQQYKLGEEIGRGGSAVVYRAHCLALNEVVAIKCVDLDKANADLNKVQQEAQTLMLISHPNVLSAHCAFVVNKHLWEVMPFMAGGSFQNLLEICFPGGLEEHVIATVLKEVLKALDYLHNEGHIHRDVKAGNILVDHDGAVKLADYGVSAFIFESGDRGKMKRNTISGTVFWMAPEVVFAEDSKQGYDCKADIWSFGITAMELAQGRPPFFHSTPMEFISSLDSGRVPKLTDPRFSKSLKEMVSMCLVHDPHQRPTAEKLLKHPFIKNHAKTGSYIVKHVLEGLHPLAHRLKIFNEEESVKALARLTLPPVQDEGDKTVEDDNWDFDVNRQTSNLPDIPNL